MVHGFEEPFVDGFKNIGTKALERKRYAEKEMSKVAFSGMMPEDTWKNSLINT